MNAIKTMISKNFSCFSNLKNSFTDLNVVSLSSSHKQKVISVRKITAITDLYADGAAGKI